VNWSTLRWYSLSSFIILVDQLTKSLATKNLLYGEYVNIFSGLNLILVHNTGAAFSFLSDAGGWQRWLFLLVSLSVSIILIIWIFRLKEQQLLESLSLALILGGAIGNLVDRIFLGYIIDFIDIYYKNYHWPVFNVADASITLGVVFFISKNLALKK
jgi:signal peptidase II|tara:strand:- start:1790 stop:2260 length:471 start_codon:yes stop_codon:yes gene_type:complete